MNDVYDFDERLEWMREQRTLLDVNFYPRIAYDGRWVVMAGSRGSEVFDKNRHVDVAMMTGGVIKRQKGIVSGIRSLTIDEKIDSENRSTLFFEWWSKAGNIAPREWLPPYGTTHAKFMEFISGINKKVPGWGQPDVSDADILLWAFKRIKPPGLKVYMFWLQELIEWVIPRRGLYRIYPIPNKGWITWGYSIPINGPGGIPSKIFFGNPDGELIQQQLDFSLLMESFHEQPEKHPKF